MAKKRKFCAYRALERPYTRKSKFRNKSYVRAAPVQKIVRFDMGNLQRKDWPYTVKLISKMSLQMRDIAIESARQAANKLFETEIGNDNYHFRIRTYPHHMLRENPLASGAGADRMSTGMQKSFGKVIGVAAQIKKGKSIFEVYTTKEFIEKAKEGLHIAATKMPSTFTIQVVENKKK